MKIVNSFFYALLLILFSILSCADNSDPNKNLSFEGKDLEIFGPGLISTGLYERDIAISPNQKEIIFTIGNLRQNKRGLASLVKVGNSWEGPKILNISGKYQDIEPFFSEKGERLFFASDRPLNDEERKDYNIWFSDKVDGKWSEPRSLDTMINTRENEFYPSISSNGNLYFTAIRNDGIGSEDIFVAKYIDGTYQKPEVLDTNVNTKTFEFNAFISPDEKTLVFSSFGRPDGNGGGDLYVSRKDDKGSWTKSQNLGPEINSSSLDYCPFIDFETNTFYFTSERSLISDTILNDLKLFSKQNFTFGNGLGDIYKVKWNSN